MARVRIPKYELRVLLGKTAKFPILFVKAQRVYSRNQQKFNPIGWTGFYKHDWNAESHYFIVLDEELAKWND
jgi:hypothetical protein